MAPDQYDADINIEGFRIWKIKIADQSFGMDILGTEQEILPCSTTCAMLL